MGEVCLKKVFISQSFSLKNWCTSLTILNILSIFFCFGIFLQCTSTVYGSKSYQKERETGRLRRTVKVNICEGQCIQCTMYSVQCIQCTVYNSALTRPELIFFSSWSKWFKKDILVSIQRYSIFLNIVFSSLMERYRNHRYHNTKNNCSQFKDENLCKYAL